MSEIQDLATILHTVAAPGMKPKDLIAAVREKHPDASKKAIVRAAFYALTEGANEDGERAAHLHAFALSERASDEDDAPLPKKSRKKGKRKDTEVRHSTH